MKTIILSAVLAVGSIFNVSAQETSTITIQRQETSRASAGAFAFRINDEVKIARNGESVTFVVAKNVPIQVEINAFMPNDTFVGVLTIGGSKLKDDKFCTVIQMTPTEDKHFFMMNKPKFNICNNKFIQIL